MFENCKFSENLQKIHSEVEEIISSHVQRLDRISSDIKMLERVLVSAGIPFEFEYYLKSELCFNTKTRHSLKWDKDRLLYEKSEPNFPYKTEESIPLIETTSNFRMSVEDELPIFYKEIINALKRDPLRSSVFLNSPNYKEIEKSPF